jgi:nicotinamide phosphoribosyltransferase
LEFKGAVEALWDIFGGTVSEQGYKVLDSHIGLIYGDAISIGRCREICERLAAKGFASTNCVYGIGSYTYQYNTRDTFGFALKSTLAVIRRTVTREEALDRWLADGWLEQDFEEKGLMYRVGTIAVEKPIWKDPKTDDGVKKSMKGKVMVFHGHDNLPSKGIWARDGYSLADESPWDLLHTIYLDGKLVREQTFSQIRAKLNG